MMSGRVGEINAIIGALLCWAEGEPPDGLFVGYIHHWGKPGGGDNK